jgi:N-acetylneuraminic acid mutarotase
MTNTERISAHNAKLQECLAIAEGLPDAGGTGKEPVLGELVVTENGVYDEPRVEGDVAVAPGVVLTLKSDIDYNAFMDYAGQGYYTVYWSNDDELTFSLRRSSSEFEFDVEYQSYTTGDIYVYHNEVSANNAGLSGAGWYDDRYMRPCDPPTITIPDYANDDNLGFLKYEKNIANALFVAPLVPADGWSKVTVNIPNDMLDVESLPDENIDTSKVYRVVENNITSANFYINDGTTVKTLDDKVRAMGAPTPGYYIPVEELPETLSDSPVDIPEGRVAVFISTITGETCAFPFAKRDSLQDLANSVLGHSYEFHGIAENIDDMTEVGYYTMFGKEPVVKSYGIPDEADNKTIYEHNGTEWIEYGSGSSGMEFNIAYGDTPPEDTSKLWVKCQKPENVQIVPPMLIGAGEDGKTFAHPKVIECNAKLPAARNGVGLGVIGSDIYILGGDYGAGGTKTIYKYDTRTDEVTTLPATLPVIMRGHEAATFGTKIYLMGGSQPSGNYESSSIYEFDAETQTTTTLGKSLSYGVGDMGSSVIGTKVYLFGGSNYTKIYNTIMEFDLETLTTTTLDVTLPDSKESLGAATFGTKVYLFGGKSSSASNTDTIYEFDADTKTITTLPETLPKAVSTCDSGILGSTIYTFGIISNYSSYDTIYEFNTDTHEVSISSLKLPIKMYATDAVTVGRNLYIIGGVSSGRLKTIYTISAPDMWLDPDHLLVAETTAMNLFNILPNMVIGVEYVYRGNSKSEGHPVEAYLYKDGEWKLI